MDTISNEKPDVITIYKLRAAYDRLSQLTWTIRDSQQRYPLTSAENEEQLLQIYLALSEDLEDVLTDINQTIEQWTSRHKT